MGGGRGLRFPAGDEPLPYWCWSGERALMGGAAAPGV
jgi:hypothetical protein